jgi:hypothetical protein
VGGQQEIDKTPSFRNSKKNEINTINNLLLFKKENEI